ncbi:MAG: FAD-dependent oxidoreductase [Clostridia bacterium]|nr:FAD-dependent oxidoreductase [Clostridia bacterium]
MKTKNYDVVVIGGGAAGLAAALQVHKSKKSVLVIEREVRLGGILKQCIHDGFGLLRFKEKLSGPEYVERFIDEIHSENIDYVCLTFVTKIERTSDGDFKISVVSKDGCDEIIAKALILANGCRERTAKQIYIHGTRPAGVYTAGSAQALTNIYGQLPTKKCVILGSGDIGLIMARRLTLEGAEVEGVYEIKPTPSGLMRNVHQCLYDYNIPLHLSHTVTRVYGDERLEGVEIMQVDENFKPIEGTQKTIDCDALILSVGLIPENELAESLDIKLDPKTKGPIVDSDLMTDIPGVFSCGNALHVNDLVDYVSESGEIAGKNAASYVENKGKVNRNEIDLNISNDFLYMVPQKINISKIDEKVDIYFRSKKDRNNVVLKLNLNDKEVFSKKYQFLRPPEMEKISFDFKSLNLQDNDKLEFSISEVQK